MVRTKPVWRVDDMEAVIFLYRHAGEQTLAVGQIELQSASTREIARCDYKAAALLQHHGKATKAQERVLEVMKFPFISAVGLK
jgi:hypothetical protein